MKKSKSTPRPARKVKVANSGKGYSIDALSRITGADPKTINKAIQRAQIKPNGTKGGYPVYADLAAIQAALAAKPDKSLRDEKLLEEIRKLRVTNDAKERILVNREQKFTEASKVAGEHRALVHQILEGEMPTEVQGHDVIGCLVIGKRYADRLCAKMEELAAVWK